MAEGSMPVDVLERAGMLALLDLSSLMGVVVAPEPR